MSKTKMRVGEEIAIGENVLTRDRGFFVYALKSNDRYIGAQINIYPNGMAKVYDMNFCSANCSLESLPKEVLEVLKEAVPRYQKNWKVLRDVLGVVNA